VVKILFIVFYTNI